MELALNTALPTFANVRSRPAQWQRLRDALLELGYREDFADLNFEEVLEKARVSESEFHDLFEDLEECYCAVYRVERDRIVAELADAAAPFETWRDRVRARAYALWRAVSDDPRITYFIFVGGRNAGERARREVEVAMEEMFDFLDEGRREPGSLATSRVTAESIGGSIWSQIAAAVNAEQQMEERVVRYLCYALVMPYLGTEAAEEELELDPVPLPER